MIGVKIIYSQYFSEFTRQNTIAQLAPRPDIQF